MVTLLFIVTGDLGFSVAAGLALDALIFIALMRVNKTTLKRWRR